MPMRCEAAGGASTPGLGTTLVIGCSASAGSLLTPRDVAAGPFCGKSGVVLEPAGAPVSGGAEGLGGSEPDGGFDTLLGIGFVTAVDQAGGREDAGASSNWPEALIGSVVAAETLGRGAGAILVEAGLSGLGGRLIRRVSRLGAFGSEPGVAESAIIISFYSYFGKCSMAKFAIVTYL